MRMEDLSDKVAVVTGGASGIGKALAQALIARGATVVIADIEAGPLEETAAQIGAHPVQVDVGSRKNMHEFARNVHDLHGGVDLLFSNAGVASLANVADMTTSDWDWLLKVNLYGLIHAIDAFLPLLKANEEGGHLALTASLSGFHVTPGMGGYTVSKFASVALAETLAAELEAEDSDVGVTILCPGPASTHLGSSQRNREPDADAGLVDNDLETSGDGAGLTWADPADIARTLLAAMARGDLYAFTHADMTAEVEERNRRIGEALARIKG